MEKGWVICYQADEEYMAELVVKLLENHGLHPVMMDHRDSEFRVGNVEVYISPQEREKALKIIEENQNKK